MSRTTRFNWLARRAGVQNTSRGSRQLHAEPLEDRRLLAITVNTLVDEADGSIVDGGILHDTGVLNITRSTLSGNSAGPAGAGGGIRHAAGTATIVNTTLSGNTAGLGQGGGISNDATLNVRHSTLTDNFAFTGGGINNCTF